jgi:hypothetical protein
MLVRRERPDEVTVRFSDFAPLHTRRRQDAALDDFHRGANRAAFIVVVDSGVGRDRMAQRVSVIPDVIVAIRIAAREADENGVVSLIDRPARLSFRRVGSEVAGTAGRGHPALITGVRDNHVCFVSLQIHHRILHVTI